MENSPNAEPKYVKIIKICALYVFPAIIFALLTAILLIPAPKKEVPKGAQAIDAEIQRLLQEKQKLSGE